MLHTTSNLYWFSFFFHSYQSLERTNDSCTWSSMKDYMLDQFILWRLLILFLVRRLPPKWFNHIVFLPCRYAYLETQSLTLSWMKIFISIKRKNRFSFLIKHFIFPVTITCIIPNKTWFSNYISTIVAVFKKIFCGKNYKF